MAKFYESDNTLIPRAIRDHLNSWPDKPVDISVEDAGKSLPAMMLQQLAAAERKKTYINGSYIGVVNFAVYVAIDAEDTASRLDAMAVLSDLGAWLCERDESGHNTHLPVLDDERKATSISITSTPSMSARLDNGVEEYQALFALEYKFSPRR